MGNVTIGFRRKAVTALIGPSGCGKTTILRCLNRIHEVAFDAQVEGRVLLDGTRYLRRRASIRCRSVAASAWSSSGPIRFRRSRFSTTRWPVPGAGWAAASKLEMAERALRSAALWDEVKDKLKTSPLRLSGGQQQRLCIARAVAAQPDVLLMDEPTASLDPIATAVIEELMSSLTEEFTIVAVTHNMQQAARVSDCTAFMLADETGVGRLIEVDETAKLFTKPTDSRTEDYITGRFG